MIDISLSRADLSKCVQLTTPLNKLKRKWVIALVTVIQVTLQATTQALKKAIKLYNSLGTRSETELNNLINSIGGMFRIGFEVDGIVLEWSTGAAGPHLIYLKIYCQLQFKFYPLYQQYIKSFVTNIGVIPFQKLQIIAQNSCFISYNPLNHNCQHFIDKMLKAPDLEFHPEGEFKNFLDRIINYADDNFLFQKIVFFLREELDQYAEQNWDKFKYLG
ncbi:7291_t:CDS:2 [Dentiscutata erythropus]|uniref:7291_t:CDS:1 n=1 Tax=Dentiscutata erythropus TaxID=1348616 RepID=A0A9N8W0R6_9GLOM|nr:7291_t:CDS:2 [Dentiscutata erythropus]